jgi:hypothetical protein
MGSDAEYVREQLFRKRIGMLQSWIVFLLLAWVQPVLGDQSEWFYGTGPSQAWTWTPIVADNSFGFWVYGAEGTVDAMWFHGPVDANYKHGDPVPAGNALLGRVTLTEPSFWEEDTAYYVAKLGDTQLTEIQPVWVSVESSLGTTVYEYPVTVYVGPKLGWWPTFDVDWGQDLEYPRPPEFYLYWNKVFFGYIRGTDFSDGFSFPYFQVRFPTPWTMSFYNGEVGDTSKLLYAIDSAHPDHIGMGNVFFKQYVQGDSMSIWARIESGDMVLDSKAAYFETIEPEDVDLVFWPESIKSSDAGSEYVIQPEFNQRIFGTLNATLYWGESGDTSNSFFSIGGQDIPVLKITVPSESKQLWGRLQYGDLTIDTPTTTISPLPNTMPVIIDEPDDIALWNPAQEMTLHARRVTAVGGNLKFDWYAGESGDTSTPMPSRLSPLWEGNTRAMDVDKPEGATSYWVRVSNALGSVDSRTVRINDATQELVRFYNVPFRVRLRQKHLEWIALNPNSWRELWAYKSGYNSVFLMQETGYGQWRSIFLGNMGISGNRAPSLGFGQNDLKAAFNSLPSGRYKYRIYNGPQMVDSEEFTLVNEYLDGEVLETMPAAYPISTANEYTNGGLFEATIYCSHGMDTDTFRIYAGPIGDRSHAVEFSDYHTSVFQYGHGIGEPEDHYEFTFEWTATGHDLYWFEGATTNGDMVRSVLRYPDDIGANPTSILLPPGADIIPIPNLGTLPDVSNWKLGDHDNDGTDIQLPLKISAFTGAEIDLTFWNGDAEAVDSLNLEVDRGIGPLVLQESEYAAVTPQGRVVWTADVIGDLSKTEAYISADGISWQLIQEDAFEVNQGFMVPAGASHLRTIYWRDEMSSEAVYQLSWIDQSFLDFVEATKTVENTLVTERMGTFVDISGYPEIRHAELGWMWVHPLEEGLCFLGQTAPGRTDWNWTHPDVFPAIYNFGTQTWLYYWINGYGWFWDYSAQDWHSRN